MGYCHYLTGWVGSVDACVCKYDGSKPLQCELEATTLWTQQSHIHIRQRWHPKATEVKAFCHVALLQPSEVQHPLIMSLTYQKCRPSSYYGCTVTKYFALTGYLILSKHLPQETQLNAFSKSAKKPKTKNRLDRPPCTLFVLNTSLGVQERSIKVKKGCPCLNPQWPIHR